MNMLWSQNFKLKTLSDVKHTQFREEIPDISLEQKLYLFLTYDFYKT